MIRINPPGEVLGWTFTTHRTDRPAQTPLLALYEALAGGVG